MKNKQIIGLVVAGAVFIVTGVTSVLTNTLSANTMAEDVTTMLAGELEFDPPADDYIGVVNVVGTIQEQTQSSVLDTSSGYQHRFRHGLSWIALWHGQYWEYDKRR